MITDFTDIMSYHGNEAGGKIAAADRTSNNLAYVGSFDIMGDNLTVKANYAFEGAKDTKIEENDLTGDLEEVTTAYGDGYSVGAIYALDMGLAFGAGYGEQDVLNDNGTTDKTQKNAFGAISYTHGDFYVSGLYQDSRNTDANKVQGYEFAAAYTYGKTVFVATYNYLENKTDSADLRDSIAVDATHYFNKNFRTYASYKFNNLDSKDVGKAKASDEFVLGARYDF